DAAAAAFPAWSQTPPAARRELLQKAAGLLAERAPDIAAIVTAETGGTFGWGMFNCSLAAGMLQEAAALTTAVKGEVIPSNVPGPTRVGRLVAEMAASHLKRVLLELGGKAPLVVLPDADLDEAVAAAKFGAFMHQGQICMSTEKIVVDRSVAGEFAAKLGE